MSTSRSGYCSFSMRAAPKRALLDHGGWHCAMRMAAKGHFELSDDGAEDWDEYISRFQFSLATDEITDDEVVKAMLLSLCGRSTFETA
ncbi:UNVERIFIED_CONTAM: hypothetical protein K2H54_008044 [Gekko kuhli]